jgi:hypothetical protein
MNESRWVGTPGVIRIAGIVTVFAGGLLSEPPPLLGRGHCQSGFCALDYGCQSVGPTCDHVGCPNAKPTCDAKACGDGNDAWVVCGGPG